MNNFRKYLIVLTLAIYFIPLNSRAGLVDFLFPDPRDVIPGLDGLLDGDLCAATPGCSAIDFSVKSCALEFDRDSCVTAVLLPNFIEDCKLVGGMVTTLFEGGIEQNLGDVVEKNDLYDVITELFELRMKTPGFSQYVRDHVTHYKSNFTALPGSGKTTRNTIYYDSDNPSREVIIHELVHVWQFYKKGMSSLATAYCDEFAREAESPTYRFILDHSAYFTDYGIEQQAEIVEEYFRIIVDDSHDFCDSEDNFINCNAYTDRAVLKHDFESVIGTIEIDIASWLVPVLYLLNN